MLTSKHIEIYKLYEGNGDGFVRCSSDEERKYMTYEHWALLEDFIQKLHLVKNGLASKLFLENLYRKLQENCDSEETIDKLKQLVEQI
jgi:hypothetical protein